MHCIESVLEVLPEQGEERAGHEEVLLDFRPETQREEADEGLSGLVARQGARADPGLQPPASSQDQEAVTHSEH